MYFCCKVHITVVFTTFMKSTTFGNRLAEVRKEKKISQDALAKKISQHGAVIGRYERDEVKPSIKIAAQIAVALEVSLDYLAGNADLLFDKGIINRIQDIQKLDNENKIHLYALMDAFLRDYKAKQTYGIYHRLTMKVADLNINLPLSFNQVVEIIKQLPYNEKLKLSELLEKETRQKKESDTTLTHLASEKVLAKDWLLPEEDEAWSDL